jgi:hypothetical protein
MGHFATALAILLAVLLPMGALAQPSEAVTARFAAALAAYQARPDNPLHLTVRVDDKASVRKMIGVAGGEISLDTPQARFTLTIPPDALFHAEEITLTPVAALDGLTSTPQTLTVRIGPSDLPLAASAFLSVRPKSPELARQPFFPFGFSHNGRNAHYAYFVREGDALTVQVSHFSGFGFGFGAAKDAALSQSKPQTAPSNATTTQKHRCVHLRQRRRHGDGRHPPEAAADRGRLAGRRERRGDLAHRRRLRVHRTGNQAGQ